MTGKQGGLEPGAHVIFVFVETSALGLVMFLLDVAQADPPHLPSAIHAFGSVMVEGAANRLGQSILTQSGNHHASAAAQRVFVNKKLLFGQRGKNGVFGCPSDLLAADGAQERAAGQTEGDYQSRARQNHGRHHLSYARP